MSEDNDITFPIYECPRCNTVLSLTWDTLGARIVFCDCTSGYGGDVEQAKVSWTVNYVHKKRKGGRSER